ncbi:hypothetical protein LOZ58_006385 [Ophidiomyces ophidiicola]|nr:hypothetical protein LOZ58_006385 [Ophidiomyces ophidiicola]
MGAEISSELAATVQAACDRVGPTGRIDDILQKNPLFLCQLESLLKVLPTSLRKLVTRNQGSGDGKGRLSRHRAYKLISAPRLAPGIENHLLNWHHDPSSAFQSPEKINEGETFFDTFIGELYCLDCSCNTNTVKWRLFLICLACFKRKFRDQRLRGGCDGFMNIVSGLAICRRYPKIAQSLPRFSGISDRYDKLVVDLDNEGVIACLPDLGDDMEVT